MSAGLGVSTGSTYCWLVLGRLDWIDHSGRLTGRVLGVRDWALAGDYPTQADYLTHSALTGNLTGTDD